MAKHRYRVTGGHAILGHPPGSVFEQEIDPGQEARLIASHNLERLADKPAAKSGKEPTSTAREKE